MSLTNKILLVVVILAIAFAILLAVTANNSKGSDLPIVPDDKKKADILQLKEKLNNTIASAKGAGLSLSCQSVTECLRGLPTDPKTTSDQDKIISRLQNVDNALNDKLNSTCLRGISGAKAEYNRLLYQIADKTESLNINPVQHPEIFTDKVMMCMKAGNFKCVDDYTNCLDLLKTTLNVLSRKVPSPVPPTPSTVPSPYDPPPELTENYTMLVNVTDKESLSKYFLLDDPSGKGMDPTGGINNYSYPFKKGDEYTKNPFFQKITQDTPLISDVKGTLTDRNQGVKIGIAPDMTWNWAEEKPNFSLSAGAPRLMTQKFFKGGLFIIDIRHAPVGCAIWPALWLNAFVGEEDQFHLNKGQDGYNVGMDKLVKTFTTKENYNPVACKKGETLVSTVTKDPIPPNKKLSEYANQDIYVAAWPAGGEIDILENVSFEKQNLISIHGGAMCELANGYQNTWYHKCLACSEEMNKQDARSTCGISDLVGFGPYSGCNAPINKMNGELVDVPGTQDQRYSCLASAGVNPKSKIPNYQMNDAKDGNTQVIAPDGSFGIEFNDNGGGVYVCEWIPMEKINIWLFPHKVHSMQELKKSGGPLSDNPNPDNWTKSTENGKTLVASYLINKEGGTLTSGCDFNFMSLIINIAVGGGFGGNTMPAYCKSDVLDSNKFYQTLVADGKRDLQANEYIRHCYNAKPNIQGGGTTGPLGDNKDYLPGLPLPATPLPTNLQCYDGANEEGRNGKAYFYKSAYFDIDSIRIFQKKNMDSVF